MTFSSGTFSVAPVREAMFKHQLGKLALPEPPGRYLPEQRQRHLISSLVVGEESVARLTGLPPLHRDSFDRLLVCQALQHDLTLITVDDAMRAYPVDTETRASRSGEELLRRNEICRADLYLTRESQGSRQDAGGRRLANSQDKR